MKILVTGAKGFVGKNLCWALKNIRDGKDRRSLSLSKGLSKGLSNGRSLSLSKGSSKGLSKGLSNGRSLSLSKGRLTTT